MHLYETQYSDLHFERAGLFKAIREKYQCRDVLYPGCSVHITPSLYFPHVVYVDQSEAAAQLFAGGIARSCAQYLWPGGLLLTNNHQSDALDAVNNGNLKLKAIVQFQKGAYAIAEEGLNERKIPAQKLNSKYLKRASQGMEYVENELYYVFEHSRRVA